MVAYYMDGTECKKCYIVVGQADYDGETYILGARPFIAPKGGSSLIGFRLRAAKLDYFEDGYAKTTPDSMNKGEGITAAFANITEWSKAGESRASMHIGSSAPVGLADPDKLMEVVGHEDIPSATYKQLADFLEARNIDLEAPDEALTALISEQLSAQVNEIIQQAKEGKSGSAEKAEKPSKNKDVPKKPKTGDSGTTDNVGSEEAEDQGPEIVYVGGKPFDKKTGQFVEEDNEDEDLD